MQSHCSAYSFFTCITRRSEETLKDGSKAIKLIHRHGGGLLQIIGLSQGAVQGIQAAPAIVS